MSKQKSKTSNKAEANQRTYTQFVNPAKEVAQVTAFTELLLKCTNLYNEGHFFLKSIYLFNQECYFNSKTAEEQVPLDKYRKITLTSHGKEWKPMLEDQVLRPRYFTVYEYKGKKKTDKVLCLGLDAMFNSKAKVEENKVGESKSEAKTTVPPSNYQVLNSCVAQGVLMQLDRDWKSHEKARAAYWKDPSKFTGIPKVPSYKNEAVPAMAVFPARDLSFTPCGRKSKIKVSFPSKSNLPEIVIHHAGHKIQQIRIRKEGARIAIDTIVKLPQSSKPTTQERPTQPAKPKRYLLIDLGIDNLFTLIDDAACLDKAFAWIISGLCLKSLNQGYNRTHAWLQQKRDIHIPKNKRDDKSLKVWTKQMRENNALRNRQIKDYIHTVTAMVKDYAVAKGIDLVIIGYNQGWKQDLNLGAKFNQRFVQIPYRTLIDTLRYKLKEVGIKMQTVEESYTSKVDHWALERMGHHKKYKGRRIKRGLFRSSTGYYFNADINGAIGIGRKCNGNAWVKRFKLANRGVPPTPCCFQPWDMKSHQAFVHLVTTNLMASNTKVL